MGHSSLTLAWRRVKRGSGPGATRALKWRRSPISEPRNSTRQTPHCKSCLFYYYFIYSQPCSPDFYDFHHAARFAKLYSWKWDLPQPLHRPPSVWAGCHGRTRPFEEESQLEKIKARKQALLKPLHKMKNFTLTGKSKPLLLQHINITSKSEQNKGHLSQLRPTCNLWKAFNKCFYFKESLI